MDAETVIELLGLIPLRNEGGFYRETYRSDEVVLQSALSPRYTTDKAFSTAVYYLETAREFSALHRLPTDETYHFYLGDPVLLLRLYPDGRGDTVLLGNNLLAGQVPQATVPAGVWQGSRPVNGGFALLGTTMAPGFDFADYAYGDPLDLSLLYPEFAGEIAALTR